MAGEVNVLSPHWREVLTHAVAFTGAVLVLRRYAWRPILNLLDERRERIKGEFDAIEAGKQANRDTENRYKTLLTEIDVKARAELNKKVAEGKSAADEIVAQAKNEAMDVKHRAQEDIAMRLDQAEIALKEDMVRMAMAAAEKAIRQKLDEATHRRLIGEAIDEMRKARAS